MEMFIFPFKEVEKGSRIVIYGAGLVGTDYLNQVKASEYCDVAFIAAKDHSRVKYKAAYDYDAYDPDIFKSRKDFDYVVIASANENYVVEMKETLIRYGVDAYKIITKITKIGVPPYSQHGEEYAIYYAFKHIGYFRDGRLPSYIDVGAHHPFELSNTAFLYQMGCHGINIEANPELIENFKVWRPKDINLCVGIGAEEGEFPFYVSDLYGLNTFKKDNLTYNENLVERDTGTRGDFPVKKVINLPVKKLQNVIDEYADGKWPDFMSIDIEGMEYESLKVCDL